MKQRTYDFTDLISKTIQGNEEKKSIDKKEQIGEILGKFTVLKKSLKEARDLQSRTVFKNEINELSWGEKFSIYVASWIGLPSVFISIILFCVFLGNIEIKYYLLIVFSILAANGVLYTIQKNLWKKKQEEKINLKENQKNLKEFERLQKFLEKESFLNQFKEYEANFGLLYNEIKDIIEETDSIYKNYNTIFKASKYIKNLDVFFDKIKQALIVSELK